MQAFRRAFRLPSRPASKPQQAAKPVALDADMLKQVSGGLPKGGWQISTNALRLPKGGW